MRFTIVTTTLLVVLLLTLSCETQSTWPPNSGDSQADSAAPAAAASGCPSSWHMQGLC